MRYEIPKKTPDSLIRFTRWLAVGGTLALFAIGGQIESGTAKPKKMVGPCDPIVGAIGEAIEKN